MSSASSTKVETTSQGATRSRMIRGASCVGVRRSPPVVRAPPGARLGVAATAVRLTRRCHAVMLPDGRSFCDPAALRSISMPAATSGLTPEQISAIDAAHLWHPYSTIGSEVGRARGGGRRPRRLADADPRRQADRGARRDELLVDRDSRSRPPGAGRGDDRPAGHDEPRHVRRADPRARGPAGPAAGGDHPGGLGDGLLQRLRVGVGGGRGEDGAAVLAQPRPARASTG